MECCPAVPAVSARRRQAERRRRGALRAGVPGPSGDSAVGSGSDWEPNHTESLTVRKNPGEQPLRRGTQPLAGATLGSFLLRCVGSCACRSHGDLPGAVQGTGTIPDGDKKPDPRPAAAGAAQGPPRPGPAPRPFSRAPVGPRRELWCAGSGRSRLSSAGTARGLPARAPRGWGSPRARGNRSHLRVSQRKGFPVVAVSKLAVPRSRQPCPGQPGSAQQRERTSPARTQQSPGRDAQEMPLLPPAPGDLGGPSCRLLLERLRERPPRREGHVL
ncbi:translation initiation factor IF-2-like [Myiozetetes cayanensis]|uniref:translation initiation factor IF-2-like n=1 Tax=Myiozetetes cayanensis TaxID=478635 RepID=UPI00215DF80B|nr:translation initiation factor IF-2-like [Myiozetetes cayanensis]